jgi:hypothetical protein
MRDVEHRLGHVSLSPDDPIVAGAVGQWTLTYVVGSYGIDEGGTIKIARRFASDWGRPQFEDPRGIGYTTVTTTGEAKLRARYDPKAHVRPWMKCVVIDVYDGSLAPGDQVKIVFGDRSGGSPGIRAQSFIETAHELRFLVDPTNACLVRRIPSSPVVRIVSGAPATVVPIVPTRARVGEPVEVFVKGEDAWGNPTPAPEGVVLRYEGTGTAAMSGRTITFETAGTGRVFAQWGDESVPTGPITAEAEAPRHGRYWAELHAQSDATVGTGTEREYFAFGRDWARVDVMSHQGNDFQMTAEDWARLGEEVSHVHEDGKFVVFPGFEWSANTPAGGDRNVIYRREGYPMFRSSHWQIEQTPEDDDSPAHPASELFARLRKRVPLQDVVVAAHCGGRYADIRKYFDEEVGPLVEVCSCWGIFEWLLWDAFDKGYRVGVMCNSDGHKGRPGAEGPGAGQFGIYGGLTCILGESLTRDAVFDALQARRCYGTTGARMDLSFEVDGHPMGSIIEASGSTVKVRARVHGAGPLQSLELLRGREVIQTVRSPAFDADEDSRRLRVKWGGARIRGRGRRAIWDPTVEVREARIEGVTTFAFDSPADGIEAWSPDAVRVRSRTTGDFDGIDLWVDQSTRGQLAFRSEFGSLLVDLADLKAKGKRATFGGLDLHVEVHRYPRSVKAITLDLDTTVDLAAATSPRTGDPHVPLMVRATQVDGHIAWSSPIYVARG